MKRKSHIITRIALAATVFTTTLAGVMPMTALAATQKACAITQNTGSGSVSATLTLISPQENPNGFTLDATKTLAQNEVLTLPTLSKDSDGSNTYTFDGWDLTGITNATPEGTNGLKNFTGDVSVTANWTVTPIPKTFTDLTASATTIDKKDGSTGNITFTATMSDNNKVTTVSSNKGTLPTVTPSGKTFTIPRSFFTGLPNGDVVITATDDNSATKSVTINVTDTTATPTTTTLTVSPASGNVSTGGTLKFTVNPSASGVIYYTIDGSDPATSTNRGNVNYPLNDTVSIASSWAGATQPITLRAYFDSSTAAFADSAPISTTFSVNTITGTATTIKSFEWTTNGAELGNITTNDVSFHDGSKPAVIYEVDGTKTFTNGTSKTAIQTELDKSKVFKVVFKVDDKTHTAEGWKWDYTYTQGESKNFSGYSVDEDDAQTFYVYSEPIEMKTTGSSGKTYSVSGSNFGPANYIRLKLKIEVLKKGDTGTKGSGNVAAPTFSPASGTVVTPGTKITFSSTTSGVSFRSQSGTVNPTTSSGTAGAQILIPSGASAGEYKLNAIAYTSSSAYSDVASATYTVVTDTSKYTITEGNGQTVSSAMPATFTGSGDLGNFKALYVDDVIVPETLYTKSSGSTIITLSPTYLQTLSAGNHTVKIVYSDGYATGNFTLTAGGAATPINEGDYSGGGRASTGTDDKADLVILFVLFGMVLAGFVVSVYYRNEKIRNYRD